MPRLIDAFADVTMGLYTDSRTTRWGRYRPYLLIFAVPFGLSIMLVFTTPDLPYMGKLIWAYVTYTLMMLVFTGVIIPYISLPGVLTADPQQRLSANGYRLFFAKAASLAVNTFVPVFAPVGDNNTLPRIPGFDGHHGRRGDAAVHLLLLHYQRARRTQNRTKPWESSSACSFATANGSFWRPVSSARSAI